MHSILGCAVVKDVVLKEVLELEMNRFERRLQQFREQMEVKGWVATFLAPSGDMEYLIGVRRQRPNATKGHMHGDWFYGAIVTPTACVFVVPLLAYHFVEDESKTKPWITEVILIDDGDDVQALARQLLDKYGLAGKSLGVPREALASTVFEIQKVAPGTTFHSTWDIVAPMRAIKDTEEIDLMRQAARVTDAIFDDVRKNLKYGMTEADVMMEIEHQMLKHGTEGSSFVTGVLVKGPGVSDHLEGVTRAGSVELQPGRVIAFDFGIVLDGYVSDFGRTVHCGDPDVELRRIHELVMTSQADGLAAMKAGQITAEEANQAARNVIEEAGYGPNFFHRLGHGIGIDVHEPPFLAKGDKTVLEANMCFTVEPSIWVSGKCFSRVEDVVVVGPDGGTSLNEYTREILVL
jgi:Xaa-Pro aminopeptidase